MRVGPSISPSRASGRTDRPPRLALVFPPSTNQDLRVKKMKGWAAEDEGENGLRRLLGRKAAVDRHG